MALDPKQVLQKNIPLVVCYVAAIVPVVLWVVLVLGGVQGGAKDSYKSVAGVLKGKKKGLEDMAKQIGAKPEDVFTPEHKKRFQDRNTELEAQYTGMIKLVNDRDNVLESWLPALGQIQKDKVPSPNEMQTKLSTALETLRKDFKDIAEDPVQKSSFIQLESVAEGNQRKLQKQYWILTRILDGLKKAAPATAADPAPVRLLGTVEFPIFAPPTLQPGQAKPMSNPIPVKLVALMTLRDVPKVSRELLAQDIVFRMKALHTELYPFSFARAKEGLVVNPDQKPLYEQTIYNATLASGDQKPTDEEQWFPEPKIKVTIELEAIDFDMEAIVPTAPPPAPKEEKAPEEPAPPPKKKKAKKEDE